MPNEANFKVSLTNNVAKAARSAASGIRGLKGQLKSAAKGVKRLNREMIKTAATGGFKALRAGAISATAGLRRLSTSFHGSELQKGFSRAADGLGRMARNATLAAAAIGVGVAGALTKGVFGAAVFGEESRLAFKLLTGSAAKGEAVFQKSIQLSKELGLNVRETTQTFKSLLAQQFSFKESTELIRMVSDLRAIGIEGEKSKRVLLALTQIRAKGRFQAEEALQLAEAGVSLVLINEELGKLTGKNAKGVQKAQQAGQISPEIALKAIGRAVKRKVGIKEFGEAGRDVADNTLRGAIERFKNAPALKFLEIAEAKGSFTPVAKDLVKELTGLIDSVTPEQIGSLAEDVLKTIETGIPLVKEFMGGFSEGFQELRKELGIGEAGDDAKQLFRDLGRTIADAFGLGITLLKMLGKGLVFLNSPAGKVLATLGGVALLAGKVSTVVGGIQKLAGLGAAKAAAGSAGAAAKGAGSLAGLAKTAPGFKFGSEFGGGAGTLDFGQSKKTRFQRASDGAKKLGSRIGLVGTGLGKVAGKINGISSLMGRAGLLGAALGVGVAIGTWIDQEFKVSDMLTNWLGELTGLNEELRKSREGTRTFAVKAKELAEAQIASGQRPRLSRQVVEARANEAARNNIVVTVNLNGTGDTPKDAEKAGEIAGAAVDRRTRRGGRRGGLTPVGA